ncbi:MAG: class I SAM-dependent methyltransferase [Bryobacterales bacterium]|nr:class I SAM-dependent methyltransferase [Bryobacterales bacterium]
MNHTLAAQFGAIDIYLFDQLLKGRIRPGQVIVDAGCGGGRNLVYLLRERFDVYGVDADEGAISAIRALAADLAPSLPPDHFRCEALESMTFPDNFADVVISSAVLHFARDHRQFDAMLRSCWRVLKPGGLFFARLASTIGMEQQVQPLGGHRYLLPDGSLRYLVDEGILERYQQELGATPADPLKTTVVQKQRSMTTWVLWKGQPG